MISNLNDEELYKLKIFLKELNNLSKEHGFYLESYPCRDCGAILIVKDPKIFDDNYHPVEGNELLYNVTYNSEKNVYYGKDLCNNEIEG